MILGENVNIELKENGSCIEVNESNKKEYVKAICAKRMTDDIQEYIIEIKKGIFDMIPKASFNLLTYQ